MLAMSDEQIPMIGGPKDGETYKWTTATTLIVPDAKDRIAKPDGHGGIVTIFGEHTYEMKCYAKDGEKAYRWDYVGYEPPQ
jgi:hypothetical protein